jgi:hypothetical protein
MASIAKDRKMKLVQSVKERIFKADQETNLMNVLTIYDSRKYEAPQIAGILRADGLYEGAETSFGKILEIQFEKALTPAEKEQMEKEDQRAAQNGLVALLKFRKKKSAEVLERYFANNADNIKSPKNRNDLEIASAYKAYQVYKDMADPLDEFFNMADANIDATYDFAKDIAVIVAAGMASEYTGGASAAFISARLFRSSVQVNRLVTAAGSFLVSSNTFTGVENALKKNPDSSLDHYLSNMIMFAVLRGAASVGKTMEVATGKSMAEVLKPSLEKIFKSKVLTATMNVALKGIPKFLSVSESAISLTLYQIISTPAITQQFLQAIMGTSPTSVSQLWNELLANNITFVVALKTGGTIAKLPAIALKLEQNPSLKTKLEKLQVELAAAQNDPSPKRDQTLGELLQVMYEITGFKSEFGPMPDNLSPIEKAAEIVRRIDTLNLKIDLGLFGEGLPRPQDIALANAIDAEVAAHKAKIWEAPSLQEQLKANQQLYTSKLKILFEQMLNKYDPNGSLGLKNKMSLYLYGSVGRGEATTASDTDYMLVSSADKQITQDLSEDLALLAYRASIGEPKIPVYYTDEPKVPAPTIPWNAGNNNTLNNYSYNGFRDKEVPLSEDNHSRISRFIDQSLLTGPDLLKNQLIVDKDKAHYRLLDSIAHLPGYGLWQLKKISFKDQVQRPANIIQWANQLGISNINIQKELRQILFVRQFLSLDLGDFAEKLTPQSFQDFLKNTKNNPQLTQEFRELFGNIKKSSEMQTTLQTLNLRVQNKTNALIEIIMQNQYVADQLLSYRVSELMNMFRFINPQKINPDTQKTIQTSYVQLLKKHLPPTAVFNLKTFNAINQKARDSIRRFLYREDIPEKLTSDFEQLMQELK